jgi:hypothetical protein
LPKQLLLYMSKEDEEGFLNFLRTNYATLILPSASATSGFTPLNSLPEASADSATRKFWLQNTAVGLPLVTEFDEEDGVYLVDGFQSPVIEFLRSFTISGMMLPGRLEADMTYFDDDRGDLVSKPVEFRQWVESIEAWIRKNYRHLTLYTYAGPGAERFQKEGGIFH